MLLGVIAFLLISIVLEDDFGLPLDLTYRVACAAVCLAFIYELQHDYPGEQWPRIGLGLALLVNLGLFFTPLLHRAASKGDFLLFALPDAIVVLAARIASFTVADQHRRAMRQQMILALILAVAFCAILFTLMLAAPHIAH